MPRKYYECNVQHPKGCFPAKWWGKIKRLSGVEGSFKSRDNVLQSVHHLEGARGLTANDLANQRYHGFLSLESYALLTQLRHKDRFSPCMERMRIFWCPPLWIS